MLKQEKQIPSDFLWRRLHSISGLLLVIFVIFHLFTNAQVALPLGGYGLNYVHSVNSIHDTPFLLAVEIIVIALPFLIHTAFGICYLFTANYNTYGSNGKTPYLSEYPRNHAYTWQRITSWILIFLILAHVIHMRVIEYPRENFNQTEQNMEYSVKVTLDPKLQSLAELLHVKLYDAENIKALSLKFESQHLMQWEEALKKHPLKPDELIAVGGSFGVAELLMVRETFKFLLMAILYTMLVLATCFHAFNGLWTFMVTWGITLTEKSQRLMRHISTTIMIIVSLLGLSAIWLTYFGI